MIQQASDHGGNIAAAAARFNRQPEQFVDFSSNINPLGAPPGLIPVLEKTLRNITRYPVSHAASLRRLLAEKYGLPEKHLLVGNGASDLIHLLFLYLRPRRLLLPVPTFGEYEQAALLAGCRVKQWPLPPGNDLDPKSLAPALQESDLLVICNPNNPTGVYYPRPLLENIVDTALKRGTQVMVDESFIPFTGFPPPAGLISRVPARSNLWVLSSLTKLWALPGLRLGFLAGPAAEIKTLTGRGDPWRVNSLAQEAGIYCLTQTDDFLAKTIELIHRERPYLQHCLEQIPGLKVFPGRANFLLVRIDRPAAHARELYHYLGRQGLLIREAGNFRGLDSRYFRIAVRQHRENRRLLDGIQAFFAENSRQC